MALSRRRSTGDSDSSSEVSPETCKLSAKLQTMWDFLSLLKWEDGTSRQTGTILLFTENGRVKASLHDRDGSVSAFVSATSLTACLEAIDKGLDTSSLDWREKKEAPRTGNRKFP